MFRKMVGDTLNYFIQASTQISSNSLEITRDQSLERTPVAKISQFDEWRPLNSSLDSKIFAGVKEAMTFDHASGIATAREGFQSKNYAVLTGTEKLDVISSTGEWVGKPILPPKANENEQRLKKLEEMFKTEKAVIPINLDMDLGHGDYQRFEAMSDSLFEYMSTQASEYLGERAPIDPYLKIPFDIPKAKIAKITLDLNTYVSIREHTAEPSEFGNACLSIGGSTLKTETGENEYASTYYYTVSSQVFGETIKDDNDETWHIENFKKIYWLVTLNVGDEIIISLGDSVVDEIKGNVIIETMDFPGFIDSP